MSSKWPSLLPSSSAPIQVHLGGTDIPPDVVIFYGCIIFVYAETPSLLIISFNFMDTRVEPVDVQTTKKQ